MTALASTFRRRLFFHCREDCWDSIGGGGSSVGGGGLSDDSATADNSGGRFAAAVDRSVDMDCAVTASFSSSFNGEGSVLRCSSGTVVLSQRSPPPLVLSLSSSSTSGSSLLCRRLCVALTAQLTPDTDDVAGVIRPLSRCRSSKAIADRDRLSTSTLSSFAPKPPPQCSSNCSLAAASNCSSRDIGSSQGITRVSCSTAVGVVGGATGAFSGTLSGADQCLTLAHAGIVALMHILLFLRTLTVQVLFSHSLLLLLLLLPAAPTAGIKLCKKDSFNACHHDTLIFLVLHTHTLKPPAAATESSWRESPFSLEPTAFDAAASAFVFRHVGRSIDRLQSADFSRRINSRTQLAQSVSNKRKWYVRDR